MSTDDFIEETLKVNSKVVALPMLKIMHDDFDDDIRIVGNTVGVTHNSDYYEPYAVSFPLMSEGTSAPSTTIKIDGVTRTVTSQLRTLLDSLTIEIFVVSSLDVDIVELDIGVFNITKVTFSGNTIAFTVSKPTVLDNSLSSYTLDADNFPGLFLL